MKKALLIIILIPLFCHSQSSKHNVFGIDLDLDWYSLTNYSKMTYFIADEENNKDPYVITDFNYYHNKIDPKFMEIGFTELLLGFPKGMQSKLDVLKPEILIARIYYNDKTKYKTRSNDDVMKILSLLKEEFGDADLNIIKEDYSLYKWNGVYYETILTCREDELTTTYTYIIK